MEIENRGYICTCRWGDDVLVDIYLDEHDTYEAWLYREKCGIKSYMFGMPRLQHTDRETPTIITFGKFLDLVECNVEDYLPLYDEEYIDGCECSCDGECKHCNCCEDEESDCVYYFYWHCNEDFPKEVVLDAISDGDYDTFLRLQREWGERYMPNYFCVGEEDVEINAETFDMIDYGECECG